MKIKNKIHSKELFLSGMEFEFIKDDDYEFEDEIPQEKKPKEWTVQKEAGLRTGIHYRDTYFFSTNIFIFKRFLGIFYGNIFFSGFTEKEREISHNAILSQQTMNNSQEDIDEEDGPSGNC